MSEKLFFKVNAGIKNIVGKELIHSDNIAVIELVKNAKDADASYCKIFFRNEESTNGSIIIFDDGCGMSKYDIENKWLNVAYSIKKKKTKRSNGYYAGSKGVGRFSCDRLGSELLLFSRAKGGECCKLTIRWADFEDKDVKDTMSSIPVWFDSLDNNDFSSEIKQWINIDKFDQGTLLVITKLRSEWNAIKLKKLISELEKFGSGIDDDFGIFLYSANSSKILADKVNRRIRNNIFEKLNFRTTRIESKIDEQGRYIQTSLFYQDKRLYSYEVENPYSRLKNISSVIYYVDPLARAYFTKTVGMKLVDYGSIFLFYNGYRISPYGNAKNDWLGLDQRKAQGRARYFGTRELLGKIYINDDDNTFEVLSNREGLAQNQAFLELVASDKDGVSIQDISTKQEIDGYGYIVNIIRQLENFVVNGLEWNRLFDLDDANSNKVISDSDVLKNPARYSLKPISSNRVKLVCDRLLKSKWKIEKISINEELIRDISKEAQAQYDRFLKDFLDRVSDKTINQLTSIDKANVKRILEREISEKKVAQKDRDIAVKKEKSARAVIKQQKEVIDEKKKTIQQINSQNMFLRRTANQSTEDLLSVLHSVIVYSSTIKNYTLRAIGAYRQMDRVRDWLLSINDSNAKILSLVQYATVYNFADKSKVINGELTLFIHECLSQEVEYIGGGGIEILSRLDLNLVKNTSFVPLEVMMAIQNIVSNSKKAKATQIVVSNRETESGHMQYIFADNGNGLDLEYKNNPEKIFEKGETTTSGSGLGLYQIKRLCDRLNGKVSVDLSRTHGFVLVWEI